MTLRVLPLLLVFGAITVLPACGSEPPTEEPVVEPEPEPEPLTATAMNGYLELNDDTLSFTACGTEKAIEIKGDAGMVDKVKGLALHNDLKAYAEFQGAMIESDAFVQVTEIALVEARGRNACGGENTEAATGNTGNTAQPAKQPTKRTRGGR